MAYVLLQPSFKPTLFAGLRAPSGTRTSKAQPIGRAVIQQATAVIHRGAHADRRDHRRDALTAPAAYLVDLAAVPLLVMMISACGNFPHRAAEDLSAVIMRRYERASTAVTSNRPLATGGNLLSETAAVTALLDRLLHHGHVLKMWASERSARSVANKTLSSSDTKA